MKSCSCGNLQKSGSWHCCYSSLFSSSHVTYLTSDVQVRTSLWGLKIPGTWGPSSKLRLFGLLANGLCAHKQGRWRHWFGKQQYGIPVPSFLLSQERERERDDIMFWGRKGCSEIPSAGGPGRESSLSEKLLKEWSGIETGCPGKLVQSPSPEVLKKCVDMALQHIV